MPLKVSDGMGAWIDDFKKSDAPQFKDKDAKERRDMAIAAYMKAKNESVDEAIDMSKVGTKATIMHPVTRVSKKVDKKDVKKHVDAGWLHMGPKRNRVTKGPYKVKESTTPTRTASQLATRDTNRRFDRAKKAAKKDDKNSQYRTSKSGNVFIGLKKEGVDEVLDTPKAMQSYKDKAKYSKDRATNSAVANILRKTDHSADLKTRAKRVKGLGMADRNAVRKFRKTNESVDLNEEMTFRVDIEGLPAMFMQAAGPGALKQELRKIVKQPSMIRDVKRVTDAVVKRTFRLKAQGRDDDSDGEIDERTDQWYDDQPEWGTNLSTIRARKKTPGQ